MSTPIPPTIPVDPTTPATPATPAAPAAPTDDCTPGPCVPTEFDMNMELKPIVKLSISKPAVSIIRNNAICVCEPCATQP